MLVYMPLKVDMTSQEMQLTATKSMAHESLSPPVQSMVLVLSLDMLSENSFSFYGNESAFSVI